LPGRRDDAWLLRLFFDDGTFAEIENGGCLGRVRFLKVRVEVAARTRDKIAGRTCQLLVAPGETAALG
jgi:hypothetical protein